MSRSGLVSLVKLFRPSVANDAVEIVRWLAARSAPRTLLNSLYSSLSPYHKSSFHRRFSTVFRGYEGHFESGTWCLSLCGRPLVVPLRRESAWLDWDAALSILGHDSELKETYSLLVQLEHPPRLVLDIGANYGTHSMFFLSHGIQTISFEPNVACHVFFRRLCESNGINGWLERMAIGARHTDVDLWYPPGEEWLGTTDPIVRRGLRGESSKITVSQTTVDEYVQARRLRPDLLKIDTEGTELQVLEGAVQTLSMCRPAVLFESWRSSGRDVLAALMDAKEYGLCRLPLLRDLVPDVLSLEQFHCVTDTNFAALPREMLEAWPPQFS